ncbi:MAG: ATP-binding protein, partial [Sulfuritalea sp.]|nr:ATP-binding protein [Sulfuritalea sp.]
YGVSMQFAVKSIDSWFDVRVDAALEGGLALGRSVLDTLQVELLDKARGAALELGDDVFVGPSRLNRLREQAGAQSATLLTLSGQVLGSSSAEMGRFMPSVPAPSQLRQARGARGLALVGDAAGGGLMVRALVPVAGSGLNADPRILQLTALVPDSLVKSAESVEAAHRDYQELQLGRVGLKRIYTLTLTLALLLALFAAIALAFFLAERLARPLLILAEGTRAVAAGDFTPRATVEASDELGVLTHSFNTMTHQLGEARAQAEHHRLEMEAAQAYLESVLANLSAGVLAFDLRFRLRAANRGALAILDDDLSGFEQTRLQDWPRHETLAAAILEGFARRGDEWQEQLEIARPDGMPQALLVRGTALPASGGGGYVVVFDDITRLIAAQRSAAWGEVAQRLAHEIKNPLTPIQLSAERLQLKLADQLTGASRDLLDRATQTIVNQVEAMKNMVNDFRDYARTPLPQLAAVDLRALLGEVLGLYEESGVTIAVTCPRSGVPGTQGEPASTLEPLPPVLADANQLRQVLHNVLTNAQDALSEAADARITITTAREAARVRLTVSDNGPGFPPQILSRAFEPYVTTKSRGTGLGLAIVKKIVDDHGGEIRLANHPGGEVSIWLPLATQDAVKGA